MYRYDHISDPSEFHEAGRFFHLVSWCVLFWSILWFGTVGAVMLNILASLWGDSQNSDLEATLVVILLLIFVVDSVAAFVALIVLYFRTKNVAKLISHPDWRKTGDLVRTSFVVGLVCLFFFWPVGIVSLHVWLVGLARLCGIVGVIRESQLLQQRAKQACRNWWMLAFQTLGLIVIGVVLAIQASDAPFIRILSVLLLISYLYCLVYMLTVLRLTRSILTEAKE